MMAQRWFVICLLFSASACGDTPPAGPPGDGVHLAPDTLNRHPIPLDASDKLLSWVTPQAQAYDQIVTLAWGYLRDRVPTAANGLKAYYSYPVLNPDTLQPVVYQHNVAGLFAMFTDSLLGVYQYTGDPQARLLAQQLLDYDLAHGMTPAGWDWSAVPYSTSAPGATEYEGHEGNFPVGVGPGEAGVLEPDKVGELGTAFLRLFELTGDAVYRDAALRCGDALASHARPGDERASPWPFRVHAQNNQVAATPEGVTAAEDYCANTIGPIKLFDELTRLGLDRTGAYQRARATAWSWTLAFPMKNNRWANYFEDVQGSTDNLNQYAPLELARYLLEHPETDPEWRAHADGLLQFVAGRFARQLYGAEKISEQDVYAHPGGSHTARYASVQALWYERTGDAAARERALRSFNWASYLCSDAGVVLFSDETGEVWFSDGYGDYLRHFLAGLGSVPAWAPPGRDHLLRSTSVVQQVTYGDHQIDYRTFDADATEVLRLSAAPTAVLAGGAPLLQRGDLAQPGWVYDAATQVLRLRHQGQRQLRVTIERAP